MIHKTLVVQKSQNSYHWLKVIKGHFSVLGFRVLGSYLQIWNPKSDTAKAAIAFQGQDTSQVSPNVQNHMIKNVFKKIIRL